MPYDYEHMSDAIAERDYPGLHDNASLCPSLVLADYCYSSCGKVLFGLTVSLSLTFGHPYILTLKHNDLEAISGFRTPWALLHKG